MTKKKYSVDFRKMIVKLYQDGAPVADLTDTLRAFITVLEFTVALII
ncbi:hypothetical protein [Pediococcus damnosus]|nr:hypothetical protein [Pediococcus damnosus]